MIRSFDWRDVGLVRRLSEQGICLDAETGLTRGAHALQSALLAYLAPGVGAPTFVWRNGGDEEAFGQIHIQLNGEPARLLFFAPRRGATDGRVWRELLEKLIVEAGQRGAHNLLAEVDENSPEFEALRSVGFAIYARQDIWRLVGAARTAGPAADLRPLRSTDVIGIQTLYANVVPRLIQQVEPPPLHAGRGYVLADEGEVLAFLDAARGPLGVWVEPFLHPEAFGRAGEVIAAFLKFVADRGDRPVYFCVRSYQDWLHEPLAEAGFELWGEQAVMVKRLAVRVAEVEVQRVPALAVESGGIKMTTPIVKN